MDLTTVARAKTYMGHLGSENDTLLAILVTGVSSQVETYLNRHTEAIERSEYFDVDKGQKIFSLRGYPVDTGEAITVANDDDWDFDSADELDADDFTVLGLDGLLQVPDYRLIAGPRALKVTYTGGMAADTTAFATAFPDVELAALIQVAYDFRRRKFVGDVASAFAGASVSFEFPKLLPEVEGKLEVHRRWQF